MVIVRVSCQHHVGKSGCVKKEGTARGFIFQHPLIGLPMDKIYENLAYSYSYPLSGTDL
jgi:hypothetical protein